MGVSIDDPAIVSRARSAAFRGFASLEEPTATTLGDSPKGTPFGEQAALRGKTAPDGRERRLVQARGENPFCGDELEVRVLIGRSGEGSWHVVRAAFDGYGCTLCLAAADAVMEHVAGMEVARASALGTDDVCRLLGGLEVGRTRRGCVDLAARVLSCALAPVLE